MLWNRMLWCGTCIECLHSLSPQYMGDPEVECNGWFQLLHGSTPPLRQSLGKWSDLPKACLMVSPHCIYTWPSLVNILDALVYLSMTVMI